METKETQNPQLEQTLGSHESADVLSRIKANKKLITGAAVAVVVVIIAALAWYFINQANSRKADEAAGRADVEQNDSIALQLYKEAATYGHASGNRAKLEVAMRLYEKADYQGALEYLEDASIDDHIVAAGALTLKGDCLVNLEKYDEALGAYDKAISKADKNPAIVPLILIKKANIFHEQKNYTDEAAAYKTILDEYAQYNAGTQFDVRKAYSRANALAQNK